MDDGKPTSIAELRLKPHYSYSALSLFTTCPLAYCFRYVRRLQAEHTSKCLLFGTSFHRTLDRLAAMKMGGVKFTVQDAQRIFAGEWKASCASAFDVDFETPEEPSEMLRQGELMIASYLDAWKDAKILAHAQAFSIDVLDDSGNPMSKPVIGEYDLVVENEDGKPLIVDFKTAGRKWDEGKPHKDAQATLYCMSYWMVTGIIPEFRFDVITKTKTPCVYQLATTRNEDSFQRLAKVFHSIDRAIQSEAFFPIESSFLCGGCEYASSCASWHRPIP